MSELVERWPGYDEQSWAERFAELNRRHDSLFRSFNALHEEAIKALAEKRDRIEALERELAEGWHDIATAPAATAKESGNLRVLVVGGIHKEATIVLADGEWWRMRAREGGKGVPTHWRPLPEPPAIRSGDAG